MPEETQEAQVLPINPCTLTDEESARLHCVKMVENEEGTAMDEVPVFLEDIGPKERQRAIDNLTEVLLTKIIKGTAEQIDIERFNALQNAKQKS